MTWVLEAAITYMLISGIFMTLQSLLLPSLPERLYFLFVGSAFLAVAIEWHRRNRR